MQKLSPAKTALVFSPKFRGEITEFQPCERIITSSPISAAQILPIVSTKRSDNGSPEVRVIFSDSLVGITV